MSQSKTVDRQVAGAGFAVAAVLAAVMIPVGAADHGAHGASDVTLTAGASLGDAFDLAGLLQAEVSAGEGVFNGVFGFPGALIGDVVGPIEAAIKDIAALNFGEAFSAVAGIPVGLANTLINLPVGLVEGIYNMILTLPGQYLFNFGVPDSTTSNSTTSDATTSDSTTSDTTTPDTTAPDSTAPDTTSASAAASDLDFTTAFHDLTAGFGGEDAMLTNTFAPILGDIAGIVALNPVYNLLDFDPVGLLQA